VKMTETKDMRCLLRDARHERRVQVIRLRKVGHTYEAIAAQNELSHTGVFNICQHHANSGVKALRDAVGGRKTGDGEPKHACISHAVVKGLNVLRDLTFGLLTIDEAPVMDQLCLQ